MNRTDYINPSIVMLALIFKKLTINTPVCSFEHIKAYEQFMKEMAKKRKQKAGLAPRKGHLPLSADKGNKDKTNRFKSIFGDIYYKYDYEENNFTLKSEFTTSEGLRKLWEQRLKDIPEDYLLAASSNEAIAILAPSDSLETHASEVRKFIVENTPWINPALIMIALIFQSVAMPERKACTTEQIRNFAEVINQQLNPIHWQPRYKLPIIDYDTESETVYKWNAHKTYRILQPPYTTDDNALLNLWTKYLSELPAELIKVVMSEEALVALLGAETAMKSFDAIVEFEQKLPNHTKTKERT